MVADEGGRVLRTGDHGYDRTPAGRLGVLRLRAARLAWSALALLSAIVLLPAPALAQGAWSTAQAENLLHWIERAPGEGLELPADTAPRLRSAIDAGDTQQLQPVAHDAALLLMQGWRGRCCSKPAPSWWHIDGHVSDDDLRQGLDAALESDRLDLYLRSIRPSHPLYESLVDALAAEEDPSRRAVLKTNLARWRWLPASMGPRYLLVNIASQKLTLWEAGKPAARWRVIVGKPATRTPVFRAEVSGVVLNPWWEIPSSIAAEGIARLVQRNPAAARARGYVYQNGRYRQMPGDNNALGRMKLVMPNPYSVFLHDTSNRDLFAEDDRFFSHGCVRVDRALSFAATLLEADGWDEEAVNAQVATGETRTVTLSRTIPLYVTYFTAEAEPSGEVRYFDDAYGRDPAPASASLGSDRLVYLGAGQKAELDAPSELGEGRGCAM